MFASSIHSRLVTFLEPSSPGPASKEKRIGMAGWVEIQTVTCGGGAELRLPSLATTVRVGARWSVAAAHAQARAPREYTCAHVHDKQD